MGLSQTAVTQRIQSLEKELKASLFIRSRKGMVLTKEGQSLLRYCLDFCDLEGRVIAEIAGRSQEGDTEIRIAGPTSFVSGRAIPQCKEIYKKWPRLNIRFLVDDRENRIDLVKKGEVDLVILYPHQVPLELDSKILKPDEYLLVASTLWRGRGLKEILENERLFAFHPDDPTSLNYLKAFDLLKSLRRPRLFVNENLGLTTLISAGVGFGILTRQIAFPYLETGSLMKLNEGKILKDALALAWYPRREMPSYMKDIICSLK